MRIDAGRRSAQKVANLDNQNVRIASRYGIPRTKLCGTTDQPPGTPGTCEWGWTDHHDRKFDGNPLVYRPRRPAARADLGNRNAAVRGQRPPQTNRSVVAARVRRLAPGNDCLSRLGKASGRTGPPPPRSLQRNSSAPTKKEQRRRTNESHNATGAAQRGKACRDGGTSKPSYDQRGNGNGNASLTRGCTPCPYPACRASLFALAWICPKVPRASFGPPRTLWRTPVDQWTSSAR